MKDLNIINIENFDIVQGNVNDEYNKDENIIIIFFEMDDIDFNIPQTPVKGNIFKHDYSYRLDIELLDDIGNIILSFNNIPSELIKNILIKKEIFLSGLTEKVEGGIVFTEKLPIHSHF